MIFFNVKFQRQKHNHLQAWGQTDGMAGDGPGRDNKRYSKELEGLGASKVNIHHMHRTR